MKLMRGFAPDLVVVSQGNIEHGLKGVLAARWARLRCASYIPLAFTFAESGSRLSFLRDSINRLYYQLPDAFVVEADYQANLLRRFAPGAGIHVVRYPIDLSPCSEARTTSPTLASDGALHVAIIGRVYFGHKNQDVLVSVAERLRSVRWRVVFHIVGDGPDGRRLRQMVDEHNLAGWFRFHGWVPKDKVFEIVCDEVAAVLIPSHHEGIPLVMLEALALGKPLLVSRLEFVEEYGVPDEFLVMQRDAQDIADKLQRLVAAFDPARYASFREQVLARHRPAGFEAELRASVEVLLANGRQ
jgi:glycosyltransferase involved in cell wall biosynthesis